MKTAEEILREYVSFDDINGSETVELLPLTIIDAMDEYLGQFVHEFEGVLEFHERIELYYEKMGREGLKHEGGATCSPWYAWNENQWKNDLLLDNAGISKVGMKLQLRAGAIKKDSNGI